MSSVNAAECGALYMYTKAHMGDMPKEGTLSVRYESPQTHLLLCGAAYHATYMLLGSSLIVVDLLLSQCWSK